MRVKVGDKVVFKEYNTEELSVCKVIRIHSKDMLELYDYKRGYIYLKEVDIDKDYYQCRNL